MSTQDKNSYAFDCLENKIEEVAIEALRTLPVPTIEEGTLNLYADGLLPSSSDYLAACAVKQIIPYLTMSYEYSSSDGCFLSRAEYKDPVYHQRFNSKTQQEITKATLRGGKPAVHEINLQGYNNTFQFDAIKDSFLSLQQQGYAIWFMTFWLEASFNDIYHSSRAASLELILNRNKLWLRNDQQRPVSQPIHSWFESLRSRYEISRSPETAAAV